MICTLESPEALLPILRKTPSSFRGNLRANPIFRIDRKTPAIELSLLNAGTSFAIELPIVWNTLTGQVTESEKLWVYLLS